MINFKIIYKILGSLLFIEAFLMAWCLGMALFFEEDDILTFSVSIILIVLSGIVLRFFGRNAENNLSRKDSFLVVTLAWVIFSVFGTMPFLLGGYMHSFTDAFFENISGFTTTGATVIDDVEALPHGILFWRSLTQWIGGLGIVFFTVALLPSLVGGSTKVFSAESTGPIQSKLAPKLSMGARWIWMVYLTISVLCVITYMAVGMDWFAAVNYAMSTVATGGFAVHNNSIAHYHSAAVEYATAFFCFMGGVNYTLLYFSVAKLKIKSLFKDSEFRFYLILLFSFTAFIAIQLILHSNYQPEHAFRSALFQVASCITSTGLSSDNAGLWPHITWVILALAMFIGACSGSTSGGFKSVRALMLLKNLKNEFRQRLHPNAVLPLKISGVNIPNTHRASLLSFFTIYLMIVLVFSFCIILTGVDNTNAITISLSCMGNIGPTFGTQISPVSSWAVLPSIDKWMCSIMMLLGRLEIFTVMVIFTPSFWTKN